MRFFGRMEPERPRGEPTLLPEEARENWYLGFTLGFYGGKVPQLEDLRRYFHFSEKPAQLLYLPDREQPIKSADAEIDAWVVRLAAVPVRKPLAELLRELAATERTRVVIDDSVGKLSPKTDVENILFVETPTFEELRINGGTPLGKHEYDFY